MIPTAENTAIHASPVSLHERCQYTNKQCPNRRMTKRNGQLHRLCVEHRDKANANHRRWLKSRVQQAKTTAGRPERVATEPTFQSDATSNNVTLVGDNSPSLSEISAIFLDEDKPSDFVNEFLLTPEELRVLHEDVIKECRFLAG
jgi:hypothetical protein